MTEHNRRRTMSSRFTRSALIAMAFVATACSSSSQADFPAVTGRRVQGASVVAHGGVPYRVGAYELVFAGAPGAADQERRAALLVDLASGQGPVHGFVEWGRAGEPPLTYAVGGWAWQRDVRGESVTVFELALSNVTGLDGPRAMSNMRYAAPRAVRVVLHEDSGDATLVSRR
jgi:hypothetical protein